MALSVFRLRRPSRALWSCVVAALGPEGRDGLAPPGPPALHYEALALDSRRDRVVLFGGNAFDGARPLARAPYHGETWEWDGADWRRAVDSAAGPGHRTMHAMAFDPVRGVVVLFGGEGAPGTSRGRCDTWTYDGAAWTRLRDQWCMTERTLLTSMSFDTRRGHMLLAEGIAPPGVADRGPRPLRLWRLERDAWVLEDSLGPRALPMTRVVFDEARGVLVVPVLGGPDEGVWEWDGRVWRRVQGAGPAPRMGYAAVYDGARRRVVLAGGRLLTRVEDIADLWTWDGHAWSERRVSGDAHPAARTLASALFDSRRGRLLLFGGTTTSEPLRDVWMLDADGWRRCCARSD